MRFPKPSSQPHFRGVPAQALRALNELPNALVTAEEAATDKAGRAMLARFVGQPRWSLANWLALRQPHVIVDEAHNTETERSFEVLKRLNPAMMLELTATPVPKRTNVLFHVSAQQLQFADMIKMPIQLMEHTRGWQAAVFDAVQTQRLLEVEAQQEEAERGPNQGAYIRPIVLLQAQNSTDCSVQSIRSATAVEQLLGRILRMPYASKRTRPALNKAYAHVTEAQTGLAANALADRLIDGMGFDPLDMASMIAPQLPLDLGTPRDDGPLFAVDATATPNALPAEWLPLLTVDMPTAATLPAPVLDAQAAGQATVTSDGERQRVQVRGAVPEALADALVAAQRGKQREQVGQQIERHNALVSAAQAPAHRGVPFKAVPRLCYRLPADQGHQGELALLEREAVFETVDLNLLGQTITLAGFTMAEQAAAWEVYLDGQKLRVGRGDGAQLALDAVHGTVTEDDLTRWVCAELQHPSRNVARDVVPSHLRAFVLATVRHLVHEQRLPLEQLARHQHPLLQRLSARIADLRDDASHTAFNQLVLDGGWAVEASAAHEFRFDPAAYPVPANKRYQGKFRFSKHYYPVLADLEDGGEEWRCALAIDEHPQMRHWVRKLDSDPAAGFWLPTSFGRFYPDFVCELIDGRLFVVQYKGAQIRGMAKEIEKGQVGKLWAEHSAGRCRFAMVYVQEAGLDMAQQLDAALR
jgi:type III restriction enzyme